MFTIRHIFVCPQPTALKFWPAQLFALWDIMTVFFTLTVLAFFIYFYFFTLPKPSASYRFFILVLINHLLNIIVSCAWVFSQRLSLLQEGQLDIPAILLATSASALVTTFELTVLIFILFKLLSFLPFVGNLKAMYRYPF